MGNTNDNPSAEHVRRIIRGLRANGNNPEEWALLPFIPDCVVHVQGERAPIEGMQLPGTALTAIHVPRGCELLALDDDEVVRLETRETGGVHLRISGERTLAKTDVEIAHLSDDRELLAFLKESRVDPNTAVVLPSRSLHAGSPESMPLAYHDRYVWSMPTGAMLLCLAGGKPAYAELSIEDGRLVPARTWTTRRCHMRVSLLEAEKRMRRIDTQ